MVCSVSEFRGHHGGEVKTAGASNDWSHAIQGRKAESGMCMQFSSRSLSACLSGSLFLCLSGFFSASLSVSLSLSISVSLSLCLSLCYLCLCLSAYLFVISVSLIFFLSFSVFLSLDRDPSQVIRTPTAVLSISTSKIKIILQSVLRGPSSWVILDSGKLAVNPSCHRVSHWSSASILFRGLAS